MFCAVIDFKLFFSQKGFHKYASIIQYLGNTVVLFIYTYVDELKMLMLYIVVTVLSKGNRIN